MQKLILVAIIAGLIGGFIGAGIVFEYQYYKNQPQSDEVVFKLQMPKGMIDENKK